VSSPLAIGAVSAVLRNLLDNGMVDVGPAVGSVKVTAVAPDTIKLDDPDAGPSLNLFLYRVTPNPGWRNERLPAYDGNGSRLTNPPLALDLHYLLTAYGASDFHAEILLGYAMSVLHERPVLDRAAIRRALDPTPLGPSILPPAFQALAASDLADQVESVTITLDPVDSEEMSRLWSAIQAHYRPTAAYLVSVVLIEAVKPSRAALPVLDRAVFVQPSLGPPLPTLLRVAPPDQQPAARLGETVTLEGAHLDGTSVEVHFAHPLLDDPQTITIGANDDPLAMDVTLPTGATAFQQWPAGVWTVSVDLVRAGETVTRTTNVAAMVLAPTPVLAPPPTITRDAATGNVTVTLNVRPRVRPSQRATLALGSDVALADPHPTTTASLTFHFGVVPDGAQWVRLTVDGAESLLLDLSTLPPSFDPSQTVTVPA
jgi:Pvc16 N-terminal domain